MDGKGVFSGDFWHKRLGTARRIKYPLRAQIGVPPVPPQWNHLGNQYLYHKQTQFSDFGSRDVNAQDFTVQAPELFYQILNLIFVRG